MSIRHLLVAVSAAALVGISTYGVLADSSASSSSGVGVVSHADQTSGSSVALGAGSSQEAQSSPGGGAAAGSSAGGGGFAGTLKIKKFFRTPRISSFNSENGNGGGFELQGTIAGAHGGAKGWAFAVGGEKPHKPRKPGEPGAGGGGSPQACVVEINDWWKWKELDYRVRRVVLNCECPTIRPFPEPNEYCPKQPQDIYLSYRQ